MVAAKLCLSHYRVWLALAFDRPVEMGYARDCEGEIARMREREGSAAGLDFGYRYRRYVRQDGG